MEKSYIFAVDRKILGKEVGDCYAGEYGESPERIQELIELGIIKEEIIED